MQHEDTEDSWVFISDLMAGLAIIFLLIAIALMLDLTSSAQNYYSTRKSIYENLVKEFQEDLQKWDAEIDEKSLIVRFKEPKVLFDQGGFELKPKFKTILRSFFPRYIKILTDHKFMNEIAEIRIEGHTSTEGPKGFPDQAYIYNMKLSQDRARHVLKYSLSTIDGKSEKHWLYKHLTANGLSSSHIILNKSGLENRRKSRRVEFRILTNTEKVVKKHVARAG